MRGVRRSLDIPVPIERAWAWLEDARNWDALALAFAGTGSGLRHQPLPGPDAPRGAGGPGVGMQVRLLDGKGGEVLRWQVTEWSPPRRLAASAQVPGLIAGFQAHMNWELESPVEGRTRARLGISLILRNLLCELLSLALPTRLFYARRLDRCLQALRAALL